MKTDKRMFVLFGMVVVVNGIAARKLIFPKELYSLCPYTSFCGVNASKSFPYPNNYMPCCQPCSCDDDCGLYGNCCHSDFDKYTGKERFQTTCRSSVLAEDLHMYVSYYKMVDNCYLKGLSNDLENVSICKTDSSSFFPVYSPSQDITYINSECAECNNVRDEVRWRQSISCSLSSDSTFPYDFEALTQGETNSSNGYCILHFFPPEGYDMTHTRCEPNIIRSCSINVNELDDEYGTLCSAFNATYVYYNNRQTLRFANVFCWLCNTVEPERNLKKVCSSTSIIDADTKMITGMSLMIVLDTADPSSADARPKYSVCRPSEVLIRSFKISCRPRRCPLGQFMLQDGCKYHSKEWYGGPFSAFLKLTPATSKRISSDFFSNMSFDYTTDRLAKWLKRGLLQNWNVLGLIQKSRSGQAVKHIIVKVTYPMYKVEPSVLRETLLTALNDKWFLQYGTEKYPLHVSLTETTLFEKVRTDTNLYGGLPLEIDRLYVPSYILEAAERQERKISRDDFLFPINNFTKKELRDGFLLSKLFFCEQVDLLPDEFDYFYIQIFFLLTNKTIYDANFRAIPKQDTNDKDLDTPTIRVCVDEFKNGAENKATLLAHLEICIMFLKFVVFATYGHRSLKV